MQASFVFFFQNGTINASTIRVLLGSRERHAQIIACDFSFSGKKRRRKKSEKWFLSSLRRTITMMSSSTTTKIMKRKWHATKANGISSPSVSAKWIWTKKIMWQKAQCSWSPFTFLLFFPSNKASAHFANVCCYCVWMDNRICLFPFAI